MATKDEVLIAIRNADAAGDSASVRKLAAYLKQAEQSSAPKAQQPGPDPTEGMSGFDKFRAGFGKAFVDIGRGVGQLVGAVSQEDIDEAKRLDAPLMRTGAGTAGNVAGNVAAAIPTVAIPGAATLRGAAALGAGMGALQPVASGESRTENTLIGGAAGPAGVLLGRGGAAAYKGGKALVEPLTDAGRTRIAGRTLERFGVGAADVAGATNKPTVTGARTTLAEQIQNPDAATGAARLQDSLRSLDPDVARKMTAREVENNAARVGTLRDMAGEGGARDFAEAMRNGTAKELYGKAFAAKMNVSALSPAERGEITKLMKVPAIQSAMVAAREIAANKGVKLGKPEGSIEGLHLMKLAMDDAANSAGTTAAQVNKAMSIKSARDRLLTFMERMSPEYGEARATYAGMSKPLNQADVAAALFKKGTSATSDLGGTPRLMPDKFVGLLKNEEQLVKSATGRDLGNLSQVLDPEQFNKVMTVGKELDRSAAVARAGNGPGSGTAQRLAGGNLLRQIAGPLGVPEKWLESVSMQTLARGPQFIYQAAEPRIQQTLAELVLDPTKARAALAAATPAQRTKLGTLLADPMLQQAVRAALPAAALAGQR